MSGSRLAEVGSLLADGTRSQILAILMDGRAYTGRELATVVGVAPSTASEHLARLLDAGMVTVAAQGRHRYFALASPEVAELLETIGASPIPRPPLVRAPAGLAYARTCYDHLAGELAVRIYDRLRAEGDLEGLDHEVRLSETGSARLAAIGADLDALGSTRRPTVRSCLDWTQRRPHLGGVAGAALLAALMDNGWAVRGPRARSLRMTTRGKRALGDHFGIRP